MKLCQDVNSLKSRLSSKLGHVRSKTRSNYEKSTVLSQRSENVSKCQF